MADSSKVKFGLDQVNNLTPEFANWIFRGYFIISKAFVGWAAAVGLFSVHELFVILTTINLLVDPIMYGFSKLFGIVPEEADPNQPVIATQQIDSAGDTKSINPIVVDPPINNVPPPAPVIEDKPLVVAPVAKPVDNGPPESYEEALKN